jgi:hypothetical protein
MSFDTNDLHDGTRVSGELDNGFKQEAHDKELLEALHFEEETLSLAAHRSHRGRARGPAEYTPVPVGGLSVYFNSQPGAMPRKRVSRKCGRA